MTQTVPGQEGGAHDHEEPSRFLVNSYREWAEGEGVPIIEGFSVDLINAPVGRWERLGVNGAVVNVAGRGDFLDMWLVEIPPGQALIPQHHLFEAVAYVISGRGSTTIEAAGRSHSFEWGPKSMFALPLNAKYQFFNASGREPARIALTTSFPITMNLYHNADFIFGVDYEFTDRLRGPATHFQGAGRHVTDTHKDLRHDFWETNFVPDLGVFSELRPLDWRGKKSNGILFLLADGVLHAHMSEITVGRYKLAHRHMGGTHIYPVTGKGYSLLWYEGDTERIRIDWEHGHVYSPPDNMYHQHFNVSGEPARYFAVKFGNYRYPVTGRMSSQFTAGSKDLRERKTQIEADQEDPAIRELYLAELRKAGIEPDLT